MFSAMRALTVAAWRTSASRAEVFSVIGDGPSAEPALREFEFRDLAAHLGQPPRHAVLEMEGAEEQHVSAPSGAGHLPSERALAARGVVGLIDEARADPGRHLLLGLPGRSE